MDPEVPTLEVETSRRRRRPLFRHRRVPVRMLVPNFFTLLGLCAGLTSIRMGIEGRFDLALAAIVFAAFLDGIDGRIARLLKASSRFGAELDSLADFVNFGVAPAFLIFNWGYSGDLKSAGWICVMMFSLASALRLARFNAAIDDDKPRWKSNYFSGMPTPAAAIVVLLPVYLYHLGFEGLKSPWALKIVFVYTLFIAVMMVSTIPTYSGKLLGERVGREWVMPMFIVAIGSVAMLLTYPYETLTALSVAYLSMIPVSWKRYQEMSVVTVGGDATVANQTPAELPVSAASSAPSIASAPAATAPPTGRIFPIRPGDPPR